MLVGDLNLDSVIKEKALAFLNMEGDCNEQGVVKVEVYDVEEGEISDSASVEEISEEAFKKQASPPSPTPVAVSAPQLKSNVNSNNSSVINNNSGGASGAARVWTMRDLYKYQISSRTSYSGLYNLAWAQAVNNKPLDEVFVMMEDSSNDNKGDGNNDSVTAKNLNENDSSKLVIDVEDEDEKEEGELEEGEIGLESEVVAKNEDLSMDAENENDEIERRKKFNSIKEELERLLVTDPEKSFDKWCSSLEDSVDSVQKMVSEGSFAGKDTLVQLLLTAIRNVYPVFSSMSLRLKEQNGEVFLRLLAHVISLKPPLFPSSQLKEMESFADSLRTDGNERKKEVSGGLNKTDLEMFENNYKGSTCLKKCEIGSGSAGSLDQTDNSISSDVSRSGPVNPKHKALALPLLDLHIDHDADSLPSPTREVPAPLPFEKEFLFGHGPVKPEWPVPRGAIDREHSSIRHRYETDAVKAVSSYQQKFGKGSFFVNEKLPSPTPSEDGDVGDSDMTGEVTSSTFPNAISAVKTSIFGQPIVSSVAASVSGLPVFSSTASFDSVAGQGFSKPTIVGPASTNSQPVYRSAKSRDPRLRLAYSDAGSRNPKQNHSSAGVDEAKSEPLGMMGSRKQRTVEELVLDGPALKRQRNESTGPRLVYDAQAVTGTGGWLEDRGAVGIPSTNANQNLESDGCSSRNLEHALTCAATSCITPNVTTLPPFSATSTSPVTNPTANIPATGPLNLPLTSQSASVPVMDSNTTASLHSLLKNIVVNPSLWMNIIKMEQQKTSDFNKSVNQMPHSNSIPQSVLPTNGVPNSSMLGQMSVGIAQTPSQAVPMEESGKVRMKPRDPRRILHDNAPPKSTNMGSDQLKINGSVSSATTSNLGTLRQEDQLDRKSASSSIVKPPDITRQFTNNLKNIADILSVSQSSSSSPVLPQVSSSSPMVSESGILKNVAGSASEEANNRPPRPPNASSWSDVEHLFEGFDDQQKAAIQKERARRLEEQKKLFSVRKLCLVLDLDHTLLNSAKFSEVDPQHDELLRKKEEQDREKPHKHLFRFPHMAMWTKLRPGIWNFLEKASKLYELHLYTMGNKYYATEMAKLLDPKGELFSGRVISRGDDGELLDGDDRVPKIKDLEGVMGMESGVVIMDDSVRVWPHNKLNLIVVERYIYFPCSRRQFGLPGPSLLEIDHDERPEDGTLASSLAVIEKIHQNFFAHQSLDEADVRNILASEQRKILAGCRIVFSRVFPVGEANPHVHPLWQTAEQFGASCTNQIDDQVTHVVANSLGTDKVNWALNTGRFVVHPGWVEASALLYRRANEHDFAIKQP